MIQNFLANMALFAGLLSLLQIGVAPGLLLLTCAATRIGGWLLLPLTLAASLVLNFELVFCLVPLGLYRIESLAIAFALVLGALAMRSRESIALRENTKLIRTVYQQPLVLLFMGFGAAGVGLVMLGSMLWAHVPGVFDSWDAVVSWNRWAMDWFNGRLPSFTYGYPQLVPSAWASTYVWVGSTQIEFFAKGLMLAFPLGVIAIFADIYARFRWPAALFAIAFWCVAMVRLVPDLVDSGYVDVAVAFFVSLTGYLLFLGRREELAPSTALWLAALSAAGAVLTKQAGAIAVLMLVWGILDRRGNPTSSSERRRAVIRAVLTLFVLTLPWFGYKFYQIAAGIDPSNVSYVTSDIYMGETLVERLWRATTITTAQALHRLGPVPGVAMAMLALGVVALKSSLGRTCWLGIVLPYYLVWALFFSYDLRNLLPAFPFVCLGLGLGLQALWPRSVLPSSKPEKRPDSLSRKYWLSSAALTLVGGLAVLTLSSSVSRGDLIVLNENKRLQAGDPALNGALLDYAQSPGFTGKIFTTYTPVAIISGLREHFYFVPENPSRARDYLSAIKELQPLCSIIKLMPRHRELKYILLHTSVYPTLIDAAPNDGSLHAIFQTQQVRFFEIACPL